MTEQPGLFWAETLLESAGRAQAAATADALRRVNAPMIEALRRQREAAKQLADLAEQLSAMAELVAEAARQQDELTGQLQAALQPYEAYQEWLDRTGKGARP